MHKITPPSIKQTAFDCPHCGALTTQYWCKLYAEYLPDANPLPPIPSKNIATIIGNDPEIPRESKLALIEHFKKIDSGLVFFERVQNKNPSWEAHNIYLSSCYNCKRMSIWRHEGLLFPNQKAGIMPNPDLPPEIAKDFEEAREIIEASPRGAAALLRLCVQKLCKHLGESGKDINADIASLVNKGLDPLIQQSLDIVRVIGNEAVHPGTIDLTDDRDTAMHLFDLINAICDQRISHPNKVKAMYGKLPQDKLAAIAKRDSKIKT